MNDIGVTPPPTPGAGTSGVDDEVSLEDSDQVAHERITTTLRWLLDHTSATQRELADLLGVDKSSVNRALLVEDKGPRQRKRDWRAREVFRLALYFDLPVEVFYGTNVEQVWQERMSAARAQHAALLKSLNDED